MNNISLSRLYSEHVGKVSDKWSLYLREYDRLFSAYREQPVRLLEIGVQNGGSLEIWLKYFINTELLLGCDINPKCAFLDYEDPRIEVIVGDANSDATRDLVFQHSANFDIVIDDGSHLSSDIIRSFCIYFPSLADGGVFVVEDLHASYWLEFEGGLFDPYSAISFFKRLADVINHEHWGVDKDISDVFYGFFEKYGIALSDEVFSHVHSVEFINSMCVIRKRMIVDNLLGVRVVSGQVEDVLSGHVGLQGAESRKCLVCSQSSNPWSTRKKPPDETVEGLERFVEDLTLQIDNLRRELGESNQRTAEILSSLSWKITRPLRFLKVLFRKLGGTI